MAVPVSLAGNTFGVMYLAGYTLDNLSLMALTVAGLCGGRCHRGAENIMRHMGGQEPRCGRRWTAPRGEIGFTVVSMASR